MFLKIWTQETSFRISLSRSIGAQSRISNWTLKSEKLSKYHPHYHPSQLMVTSTRLVETDFVWAHSVTCTEQSRVRELGNCVYKYYLKTARLLRVFKIVFKIRNFFISACVFELGYVLKGTPCTIAKIYTNFLIVFDCTLPISCEYV